MDKVIEKFKHDDQLMASVGKAYGYEWIAERPQSDVGGVEI